MTGRPERSERSGISVVRRPGRDLSDPDGLAVLLTAYHLQTQAEKGEAVADAGGLPERYRAEILDPGTAFATDVVLLALRGDAPVGRLIADRPRRRGRSAIKRLWTDPALRGLGIASGLVGAALAHAAESGVSTVRLSVWNWRTGAIALYERLGFTVTEPWDGRDRLVCMQSTVSPAGRGPEQE
ncbi:GNAT family N-acetyltransferase [Streptomyces sanglieri]|uniref:GNAT family N-acetyltransferase n=1 Tax=Streptomyces sanglieri TaxID=193460 RepID=A0ABW2WQ31_9ACTN